jgi:hypothetical protein
MIKKKQFIYFLAFNKDVKKNYGTNLIVQQFFGMFMKKMIHTLRNRLVGSSFTLGIASSIDNAIIVKITGTIS